MISDWAFSRAADCTLLVMNINAEFDKGCQQSRRLHPDDTEDGGEGGGDTERAVSRAADCTLMTMKMVVRVAETLKGPSAEPPTAPFTVRTLPFVDAPLKMMLRARVLMFTRVMGKESISWGP